MTSSSSTAASNDSEGATILVNATPEAEVVELGWWDRRTVAAQAAFALVVVLILFLLVFYCFAVIYVHPFRLWPWSGTGKHATASLYDLTRNSATVAALLGGAVAIAVTLRRQRSTERTVELTEETARIAQETAQTAQESVKIAQETANITAQAYRLDQARAAREEVDRLRDRYTTITHQLGHLAAPVRLAGVYAMAALADDWLKREDGQDEAQVCIDVLCAYVRTPRPGTDADSDDALSETRVRETITRVICHHLRCDVDPDWTHRVFDFTGAVFAGSHSFAGAVFAGYSRIIFVDATFTAGSSLRFERAEIGTGSAVLFGGAHFMADSEVIFEGSNFMYGSRVTFLNANFEKNSHLSFVRARTAIRGGVEQSGPDGPWGRNVKLPDRWPPE